MRGGRVMSCDCVEFFFCLIHCDCVDRCMVWGSFYFNWGGEGWVVGSSWGGLRAEGRRREYFRLGVGSWRRRSGRERDCGGLGEVT